MWGLIDLTFCQLKLGCQEFRNSYPKSSIRGDQHQRGPWQEGPWGVQQRWSVLGRRWPCVSLFCCAFIM